MNAITLRCLFVLIGVSSLVGCNRAGKSPKFEPMRTLVVSGQYDAAIARLEAYVAENPRGKHASRAGLFLFKANFAKGDYADAREWCDWTVKNHPNSLEARKCEFKIGLVLMAQGDLEGAQKQFEAVASSDRNPLRPEAVFFVDDLKKRIAADDREQPGGGEQA